MLGKCSLRSWQTFKCPPFLSEELFPSLIYKPLATGSVIQQNYNSLKWSKPLLDIFGGWSSCQGTECWREFLRMPSMCPMQFSCLCLQSKKLHHMEHCQCNAFISSYIVPWLFFVQQRMEVFFRHQRHPQFSKVKPLSWCYQAYNISRAGAAGRTGRAVPYQFCPNRTSFQTWIFQLSQSRYSFSGVMFSGYFHGASHCLTS